MKALLLAAGLGTRLRPITDTIPKCLVPINGKPLLQIWLENLTQVGVEQFIVNTHYLQKSVVEFVEQSEYKDKVLISYEDELLHTGGTLLKHRNLLYDDSFFLVHADNLSFCEFNIFITTHYQKQCDITMMTFETDNPKECGIVELDCEGIVQNFYEKVENPPSNLANGAVYILKPTIFEYLKSLNKMKIDFSNDVLPNFLGNIATFHNEIYHRDIGNIESYAMAQIETYERFKI